MASFIHMADCHLGGWRDPRLREIGMQSFHYVCQYAISKKVDFVIIAGDLFNTALPAIEVLRHTVKELQSLKDASIPVYYIAGSHDYSPAGKTMLHILEDAQLMIPVLRATQDDVGLHLSFITDPKTGIKLCGLLGRARSLEKKHYELLQKESLEQERGEKIFVFHHAISELIPKEIHDADSAPLSLMPKGFTYYAGGHVHIRYSEKIDAYGTFVYPGPVFPNSFSELELLHNGSFVHVQNWTPKHIEIDIESFTSMTIDCTAKTEDAIIDMFNEKINEQNITSGIVAVRFIGILDAPISFSRFEKENIIFLKNTSKLTYAQLEQNTVEATSDTLVEDTITQHLGQIPLPDLDEKQSFLQLLTDLDIQKEDGETKTDFENRIKQFSKMFE